MKAIGYICLGVAGVLVALTAIGYVAIKSSEKKDEQATPEPAKAADPEPKPAKKDDVVVPFVDPTAAADPQAAVGDSTPITEEIVDAIRNPHVEGMSYAEHQTAKEQFVKMKIANVNDPLVGSVEAYYLRLVKAIRTQKLQGVIWRGEGELPDADVIDLRGTKMDLMVALRTPRHYFESKRQGITLAYQYTTRKNPMIFVQVDDYIYVLAGDENRFLSSVPNPEELSCDPNGYLNVVLSVLLEKLGLDDNPAEA